jgi:hypothetical protein
MKVNDFSPRPWCFRLRGFHVDASFLVESMGAIVWQEYRVFTGVNLTRKMTTRRMTGIRNGNRALHN